MVTADKQFPIVKIWPFDRMSKNVINNNPPPGAQRDGELRQLGGGSSVQLAEDVCGEDGADVRQLSGSPYVVQQSDG